MPGDRQRVETSIGRATRWLLSSGIQDLRPESPMHGGVHAWFDTERGAHAFYYTEITGYALTSLLFLDHIGQEPAAADHARRAARWLITQARDDSSGALRCRFDVDGVPTGRACSFDNGACLNGLLNLYRLTGDQELLEASRRIGAWLIDTMQAADGSLHSKFDLGTGVAHDPGGRWSLVSGSYLGKVAIGLANLADVTGDTRVADATRALCEWNLAQQRPDGRFPTSPVDGGTYLHPHCYSAEGLMVAGTVLGERRWIEGAARAVGWIASAQLPTGGFPGYYERGAFVPVESTEMTAQTLRLWLLLPPDLRPPLDLEAAVNRIMEGQLLDGPTEALGAFTAGPAWFHGEAHDHSGKHANAWITMMALQTLSLAGSSGMDFPVFLVV